MKTLGPKRKELLARTIADLNKAVFAVGLASRFFKEFSPTAKVIIGSAWLLGLAAALWIQPEEKKA